MVETDNYCVGCPGMGLPCLGGGCPYSHDITTVSCDQCGEDGVTIYQDDDDQLCARCLAIKHKADFIADYFDFAVNEYADSFAADHFEPVEP